MTMLNQGKIEAYLRSIIQTNNTDLMPKDADDIKVSNTALHYDWNTNNVMSFLLTFEASGVKQDRKLFLKCYSMTNNPTVVSFEGEDSRLYVREFQTLKRLNDLGFPVPKVYLCEKDPSFLGTPFIIMRDEEIVKERVDIIQRSRTLANLHNLDVTKLEINALKSPKESKSFASQWILHYKHLLGVTRHFRRLRQDFENAVRWLEINLPNNSCPKYSLVHGDYNPDHILMTKNSKTVVIDWERVYIGDPAYDVGYAFHWIKSGMFKNQKSPDLGEIAAEQFISEYKKNYQGNISERIEFYKILGILGLAIVFSDYVSNSFEARKRFGGKRGLFVFPFLRIPFVARKILRTDFPLHYLRYCQDFLEMKIK